jgi:cytochrome P450
LITPAHSSQAKPIPFLEEDAENGSAQAFAGDQLRFLQRLAAVGDLCGFHVGSRTMVLLNKVEYVQSILVDNPYKHFTKSNMSRRFLIRDGVFLHEGDTHHQRRKLLAPVFQPRHIVRYADTIVEIAEQLIQPWSDGMVLDMVQHMARLTKTIIVKILFGLDMDERSEALVSAIIADIKYTTLMATSRLLPENQAAEYQRYQEALGILSETLGQLVEEARSQPAEQRLDILSVLVSTEDEDGQSLSAQQVIDECVLLFPAATETTMAALTWSWYFLSQHPAIYEQVRQEVQTVLQGRRATAGDLVNLPFCLQVFKEVVRLYPPIAFLTRDAREDIILDDYVIPEGTSLLLSPYTLHRNPAYFPQPDLFDPERFTPEHEKRLPHNAYLPFGTGPRICIGNHLATMEVQLVIATLVQHASFSLVPGQRIEPDPSRNVSLRPGWPVEMVVQKP